MKTRTGALALTALLAASTAGAIDTATYSWRYFRPGNTGIQGDANEALYVTANGDPYIGGYESNFEEGGFCKFVQAENRWLNYSNVDYQVMGHPDDMGKIRVADINAEAGGKLWLGTWLGVMSFDPAVGPSSITRYNLTNSQIKEDYTGDVERAPDGTIWFANAGSVRYNPTTHAWTRWNSGSRFLSAQPKPSGGYFVWSSNYPEFGEGVSVFDSDTQLWTSHPLTGASGEIQGLPGKDCVDDVGNFWAIRSGQPGDWPSLDYRRPDGTWVTPPEPYAGMAFNAWAFKAYGNGKALYVDGNSTTWRFENGSWHDLGIWRPGMYTYAVDVDAQENVWVCGIGGAAKRDNATGTWQRYRITNTGNCDDFNGDLAIDPSTGAVYATANAGAGVGGMTRFDGQRWLSWNIATYGLGHDWPFMNDNAHALVYRSSINRVVVSPADWLYGVHEWTGSGFSQLNGLDGTSHMVEDSQGRLWAAGGTINLGYWNGSGWTTVPGVGGTNKLVKDPTLPGTVWAIDDYQLERTDGANSFHRELTDFPGSAQSFTGLAVQPGGIAWFGTWTQFTSTGSTLIRLDANTGTYQTWRKNAGWPFPGEHVRPLLCSPDGRVWMQYDAEYPSNDMGLCWYDGLNVGKFPAPPGGIPQWGGLPHANISDAELRVTPTGYEIWMSFGSRGIACLTVKTTGTVDVGEGSNVATKLELGQNEPNPFQRTTRISFTLPRSGDVRLDLFDVAGRQVRALIAGEMAAGGHQVIWDGLGDDGRELPNGIYRYRLTGGGEAVERKLVHVR